MLVETDDLMNKSGIAGMLGVVPSAVSNWLTRGTMPAPYVVICGKPYWHREQIEEIMANQVAKKQTQIDALEAKLARLRA